MLVMRHLAKYGTKTIKFCNSSTIFKHTFLLKSPIPSLIRIQPQRSLSTGETTKGVIADQEGYSEVKLETASFVIIADSTPLNQEGMLEIQWVDGSKEKFPYIWLRDNCQCAKCFHETARHRMILLRDLDISITPRSVQISKAGNLMEIDWSDGHRGQYPVDWLHDRSFNESQREKNRQKYRFHRTYWGSDMINHLPTYNFNDLLQNDRTLLKFLHNIEEFGLVIVKKAPQRVGEIANLTTRIGYLKKTHYGTTFNVKQKTDANNLAYTSASLDLHSDQVYLSYKPGIQLLHCIAQVPTEGGENHLVDSFHAANQLRESHPEKFHLLATIPVDFQDMGVEANDYHFHVHNKEPMIVLDQEGLVNTVNLHQMSRDSYFDVSAEMTKDWYDAMLTFTRFLYHPDNLITYKMEDGDIAVFDNNRVLHGRRGYHMTDGTRELEGGYWDWDSLKSRRRVLLAKFGMKE